MNPLEQSQSLRMNHPEGEGNDFHKETNIYPLLRTILLILAVLFTLAAVLFLFYQNGKSIYDHGL